MLTYRTATETVMSKFFAKFSGKWTWHVLPSHPSGFKKHIGIWHHPPYRFTSVYRQNGNQVVIVVVWQWFLRNWKPSGSIHISQENHQVGQTLKGNKPKQAILSQNIDVMIICQGDTEFGTHLTNCLLKFCPSNSYLNFWSLQKRFWCIETSIHDILPR